MEHTFQIIPSSFTTEEISSISGDFVSITGRISVTNSTPYTLLSSLGGYTDQWLFYGTTASDEVHDFVFTYEKQWLLGRIPFNLPIFLYLPNTPQETYFCSFGDIERSSGSAHKLFCYSKMSNDDKESIAYYNPRPNDVIRLKAMDSLNLYDQTATTLSGDCTTNNAEFLRDYGDDPLSAYKIEGLNGSQNSIINNNESCSAGFEQSYGSRFLQPTVGDSVWVKFKSSGPCEIRITSPREHENNTLTLRFFVNDVQQVTPNGVAESSLTSYNPSFLQFRHDLRNSLYAVIDQSVRSVVADQMSKYFRLYNENDENSFKTLLFTNNERVERIDDYIKQLEYKVEQALNVIGDDQIQSLYKSIYATLQDYDSKLKDFITNTLERSVQNYELSEQLLAQLDAKAKEESLVQYNYTIKSIDISRVQITLHTQRTNEAGDISQYLNNQNGQLMISLPIISKITGFDNIDSFVPGYIYVGPKSKTLSNYRVPSNRNIQFSIDNDLTEIIGGNLYDKNGNSYKIINRNGDNWILDKNIDQEVVGTDLVFYPNYFEPQIIKLDISWLHNYIPKNIPLGTTGRPPTQIIEEPVEITQENIFETVIRPNQKENNKEIF